MEYIGLCRQPLVEASIKIRTVVSQVVLSIIDSFRTMRSIGPTNLC